MSERKKIGTTEELRVSSHGSGFYLRVPDWLVSTYEIVKGDRLRVKIEELLEVGEREEELKTRGRKQPEEGGSSHE